MKSRTMFHRRSVLTYFTRVLLSLQWLACTVVVASLLQGCGGSSNVRVTESGLKVPNPNPSITLPTDEIKALPKTTRFLILGKSIYASELNGLAKFKDAHGMPTSFVDLESIEAFYGPGDAAERVKRAIANAYINANVRYVMLVGDASQFPVRHKFMNIGRQFGRPDSSMGDGWWQDGSYTPTDHYYANLFHHSFSGNFEQFNMSKFDNWDDNGNGRYNEQVWEWDNKQLDANNPLNSVTYNPDKVDAYPDIAVGRLPIHNANDLKIILDKIMKYDNGIMLTGTKRGLALAAGGTYPGSDGLLDQILNYNSVGDIIGQDYLLKFGFNFPENNRKFTNGWMAGTFPGLRNAVNNTWGLIYLGHGYSAGWDMSDLKIPFNAGEVAKYLGQLTLPVVFGIGCETGEFKPTVPVGMYLNTYNDTVWYYQFTHSDIWKSSPTNRTNPDPNHPMRNLPTVLEQPGPYDLPDQSDRTFACPWLFQKNEGGGIAYFGETVVCEDYHGKDLIARVMDAYVHDKNSPVLLGDIWLAGQRKYWSDFRNDTGVFHNPRSYLCIMTFFGDPTLHIPDSPGK